MAVENSLTKPQHPRAEPLESERIPGPNNLRLYKDNNRSSRQKVAWQCRLKSLKILALALLSSIEALEQSASSGTLIDVGISDAVRHFESEIIRAALVETGGRQRPAARLLGVNKTTFNAKVKRYHIDASEIAIRGRNLRR